MAATDTLPEDHDRQPHRRKPFSNWVKKLTNFKGSSDGERTKKQTKTKRGQKLNNPYPESGLVGNGRLDNNGQSAYSFATQQTGGVSTNRSGRCSGDNTAPPTAEGGSLNNTASTENERPRSLTAPSHGASSLAGTNPTVGGGMESRKGGDSTFSSPAPSVQSLTTTLTTIQSVAPNGAASPAQNNQQSIQFSQPFPTSLPASAIPAHLAPSGNPSTYTTATANNLLTDNASILTLASSSKRRRRRSMDTDASVRALAPSSVWGGSRESLPLSVLSANIDTAGSGIQSSASRLGLERNSIYSTTGVATAPATERNSVYAKQGDGASVRSGLLGHGRPDSISGSIAGVTAPMAGPLDAHVGRGVDNNERYGLVKE